MPWKVRRNLSKPKTPMLNSLHCYENLPRIPPFLPSLVRVSKGTRLHLPRQETGSQANVLQVAIEQGQKMARSDVDTWLKSSKRQDEKRRPARDSDKDST